MDARTRRALERAVVGSGRAALEGVEVGQRRVHATGAVAWVEGVLEARQEVRFRDEEGRSHVMRAVDFAREWRVR